MLEFVIRMRSPFTLHECKSQGLYSGNFPQQDSYITGGIVKSGLLQRSKGVLINKVITVFQKTAAASIEKVYRP